MAQKVLITAGASGIGKEIAIAFMKAGARVFICDIDAEALKAVAQELPGITTTVCDVSKYDEVRKMVTFGAGALGGYDVLVNNAGIAGPTAKVEDITPEEWEQVINVDLNGSFYVTKQVIPYLKMSPAGVIINMSSIAGKYGYENRSPYAAAKWGIVGFTKTLSIELGSYGIRANAILPGVVAGPRIEKVLQGRAAANHTTIKAERENAMSVQSIKQFVDPKDIAALAVFLASDAAKMISGQALSIDGDTQKAS